LFNNFFFCEDPGFCLSCTEWGSTAPSIVAADVPHPAAEVDEDQGEEHRRSVT